ncbi:MAG: PVC-type heme-binding CxxCH protein [Bythopirellula sp.]|nr:PVC-type heme-binding CxxCH protein [Bythopirellula sp.]
MISSRLPLFLILLFIHGNLPCVAAPPRVLVDGCKLEQIAREPAIVTPVGMAFDAAGRLLVVESNTHQRPEDYVGPESDRLRMLSDSDGDGQLDRWSTFAEGFRHAMNVAVRPDGGVYVVTRSDVHLLRDTDGDGSADVNEKIVRLKTTVDYPHNALSGIVIDGDSLYLGVGENFGVEYDIVGSDGTSVKNIGGVGTVYRCDLDGSNLERHAEGFWNPFSLCMAKSDLFCVDNDPDASPPCRLIDVLPKGDYGFRFEYGRAGVHPLQAWNGELPGTLPMVCGTGEAPTAVLFHRGYLWVTSWGDYRIERYQLTPQANGTYTAERTIVVQGDADFRPTGMAVAPDGALWFGDWVDRSYPVHGKGRIWRLELPESMEAEFVEVTAKPQAVGLGKLSKLHAVRWERSAPREELIEILKTALKANDPDVRLFAVRWIAEEHFTELQPEVEKLLDATPPSERYFLAVLATVDWLSRAPEQRHAGIADGLLARELRNPQRGNEIKTLALNLMSPDYKDLTLENLNEVVASEHEPLQIAAARTIAERTDAERFPVLMEIIQNNSLSDAVRVEALAGLAVKAAEYRELLEEFSANHGTMQKEAQRILRLSGLGEIPAEEKPDAGDLEAWVKLLAEPGDAAAGRRLFFTAIGPRCSVCHRHGGRGGNVGPDLTQIGLQNSRERVIISILDPSREVAPHFESWILVTDDGKTHVGQRLPQGGDGGVEPYADTSGKRFELKSESITHRQAAKTSIMPAGLEKNLSIEDLRDLVTFLME